MNEDLFPTTRRGLLAAALGTAAATCLPLTASAQQKSPYEGQTVRFLTSRNIHQTALDDKMREIATKWGVTLETRYVTTDQLDKKTALDFVGGATTWDIIYTGGVQRMYEWAEAGLIADLTPMLAKINDPKLLDWDGFTHSAQTAVSSKGKIYGMPVATSEQTLAYRSDLFDNADEKAAFKKKYGYDLAPPNTYKQFHDVAEFFTRKKGDTLAGVTLTNDFYGTSNSNKKGSDLWHDYDNVLLAYGVTIYDPETGKVGITAPESVAAANFYKSLVPFWPPSHVNMSSGESTSLFVNGQVAMVVEYFDRVVSTVAKGGNVKAEQVAYAFPPTAENNPKNRVHAFRSAPSVVSIYSKSQNPETALRLLEAAITTQSQVEMGKKYPGFLPSRTAVLDQLAPAVPQLEYLDRLANSNVSALTDAEMLPMPSILKSAAIGDAMSEAISAILAGAPVEPQLARAQQLIEKAVAEAGK